MRDDIARLVCSGDQNPYLPQDNSQNPYLPNDSLLRPKSGDDTETHCSSVHTNAFERIKGAITGSP